MKIHLRRFLEQPFTCYIYIIFSLHFTLNKIHIQTYKKCISVLKQDQKSVPKQDQESLSAPSLDCLCKAGASSWSCSIYPNRTRNLSLLLPCTISARQAPLPGKLINPFTGPFSFLLLLFCKIMFPSPVRALQSHQY